MQLGTVESYDADVGLGIVVGRDGRRLRFHCTAIADGSRMIEPGTAVGFAVGPQGLGEWEATSVVPID